MSLALPTISSISQVQNLAEEFILNSKAPNTILAYRSDWTHFEKWAQDHACRALPAQPETVSLYLADLSQTHSPATLRRRIASISKAHQTANLPTPTQSQIVKLTITGICRTQGTAQDRKAPVRVEHLSNICLSLPENLVGKRDRALLLLGYAGAFRRSELVALNLSDLEFCREGVKVTVRRSKTDQEGQGQIKAIPYGSRPHTCPVRALQDWVEVIQNSKPRTPDNFIFCSVSKGGKNLITKRLTSKSVGLIVKRYSDQVGVSPKELGGHSLRAGLVTDGFAVGASEAVIMSTTGHRSSAVLKGYRREASMWTSNVAVSVGL